MAFHPGQRRIQDIAIKPRPQAVAFGGGDQFRGGAQVAFGIHPAHQHLEVR